MALSLRMASNLPIKETDSEIMSYEIVKESRVEMAEGDAGK
jgi:hypothetical protein